VVSIAESFNYRIFERKRRMGEALHESSPCMPHLSVEQQKRSPLCVRTLREQCLFTKNNSLRESSAWLNISKRTTLVLRILAPPGASCALTTQPSFEDQKRKREKHQPVLFFSATFLLSYRILFTDLSAAGLPAELKHITQRRKRKQP